MAVVMVPGCRRPVDEVTRIQFSFWGSVYQQANEVDIIAAFERENPDIKVDMLRVGSRYAEKLQSMLVGRVAPDVMMVEIHMYADWAARGVLVDMDAELAEISRESALMPLPQRVARYQGHAYALPVNVGGYGIFYNKAVLRDAGIVIPEDGLTWDWIESVAPQLARRTGNAGAPCDYVMVSPEALLLASAFGAKLFDDLERPTRVTVQTPEMRAAMEYLRRNTASGAMLPRPEINDPSNPIAQLGLFRQGRVPFHVAGRYEVPNLLGRLDFEWGLLALPTGPGGDVGPHGGTFIGVSAQSEQQEAARRFARFYASSQGVAVAMPAGRIVPAYRDMAYGEAFSSLLPGLDSQVFADTMEEGRSQFYNYTPGVAVSRRLFEDRFEQVTAEPDASIDDILSVLAVELERWLARSRAKGLW